MWDRGKHGQKNEDRETPYISKLDDFPGAKAQFFIVVQNSVHVLNPYSIHWPIKHVPLFLKVHG